MSRLEEIKGKVDGLSMIEDISYAMLPEDTEKLKVIDLDSLKWLINRVEKLEAVKEAHIEELGYVDEQLLEAQEDNQRYKEALEEIAVDRIYESELMEVIKEIAREALAGDNS